MIVTVTTRGPKLLIWYAITDELFVREMFWGSWTPGRWHWWRETITLTQPEPLSLPSRP